MMAAIVTTGISITLLLLLHTSSAFRSNSLQPLAIHRTHSARLHATQTPLVIIGGINEAISASLALCAKDVMLYPNSMDRSRSPVPPSHCIAFYNTHHKPRQRLPSDTIASLQNAIQFLGPNLNDYEEILAHSLQLLSRISEKQSLYTSLDFGSEHGSAQMKSLSMVGKRFDCVGLNLNTNIVSESDDVRFVMSRDQADTLGNRLQSVLDETNQVSVTIDVGTHLAMLQSNSLPKLNKGSGQSDVWAIKDSTSDNGIPTENSNCDGVLFEYQYNYQDPYGGSDPLMCPSMGYVVPSNHAKHTVTKEKNEVYAAAYSANIGSGLDKLSSICIATIIRSLFHRLGTTPSYSWKTIDDVVECSIQAGQSIRREDGLPRKMYKDFGYR